MKSIKFSSQLVVALAVIVVLAATFVSGYFLGRDKRNGTTPAGKDSREVLYWHDPMVPGARFDKPGKSPFMDMDLVPVYAGDAAPTGAVQINPYVVSNLGVRSEAIARSTQRQRAHADGYLYRDSNGAMHTLADTFERDVTWIRVGLNAEVSVPDARSRPYRAVVQAVEPDVDIGRRALKLRLRLRDADTALTANMIASAVIQGPDVPNVLTVPRESLIYLSQRTVVVLDLGGGNFKPVEVTTGRDFEDRIEIKAGIKEGDRVVTSGQFLIDSEASLKSAVQRLESGAPTNPAGPNHAH